MLGTDRDHITERLRRTFRIDRAFRRILHRAGSAFEAVLFYLKEAPPITSSAPLPSPTLGSRRTVACEGLQPSGTTNPKR